MNTLDRLVRWLIYQHFLTAGSPPPFDRLVRLAETTENDVRESLRRLADSHVIALSDDHDHIWMAHPFSGVPTDYRVETGELSFFANCAWDGLAIPALTGRDARILATHPVNRDAMQLQIQDGELQPTLSVIHFVVPARNFWDDIGYT